MSSVQRNESEFKMHGKVTRFGKNYFDDFGGDHLDFFTSAQLLVCDSAKTESLGGKTY